MIVLEIILICLVGFSGLILTGILGYVIDILDVLDPEHKFE